MSRWNWSEALEPLALRLDTTEFRTAESLLGDGDYRARLERGRDLLRLPVAVYAPAAYTVTDEEEGDRQ